MQMIQPRLKVLILGHLDTPLYGHALSFISVFPKDKYEVRLVVLDKMYDGEGYEYFYDLRNCLNKIFITRFRSLRQKIKVWMYCGEKLTYRPDPQGHAFYIGAFNPITGDDILAKYPSFKPDLIVMMWTRTLVTAEAVKRMYELTNARFLFVFVDDAHLSGGCHYPVDCEGYLNGCHDCPALISGKKLAEKVMADKLSCYKGIPKYVLGTPADCRLAAKSPLFSDAKFFTLISSPIVNVTDKKKARKFFCISDQAFVVFTGANMVAEVRKGVRYAVEGVNLLAEKYDNVCLLVLGHLKHGLGMKLNPKIKVIMPGFLDLQGLFKAFNASDCFLNTTIADSGPMMVNYSIALGTPVVSFYIGIAQDLVVHKKTGYIAKIKNSGDVACGMEFIRNLSPEKRRQMSENCRSQITKVSPKTQWVNEIYDNWDEEFL